MWQGSGRGEVGQAEAMGLFPGREDQPLTAWSQHRDEQQWEHWTWQPRSHSGTGDTGFMKEDAPGPLGSLEVACKGWTSLEQRVWGFKSRLTSSLSLQHRPLHSHCCSVPSLAMESWGV